MVVQETALAQARLLLPPLERSSISSAICSPPSPGAFRARARPQPSSSARFRLPRQLPLSLPADLVRQRPDVRAAEASVHAANAQIGVAIANRLPQITLDRQRRQHRVWPSRSCSRRAPISGLIAGNALQPVFDGGTLRYKQQAAEEAWCSRWPSTAAPC